MATPVNANGGAPLELRARFAALRLVPQLLRIVWRTHRPYTAAVMVLRGVRSTTPAAMLWVAKLIIDDVVALARLPGTASPSALTHLWTLVAIELAIAVGAEVANRAAYVVETLLSELVTNRLSLDIIAHTASLSLQQLEDPDFRDRLDRARHATSPRGVALLQELIGLGQSMLTVSTLAASLLVQAPWLVAVLVATMVPMLVGEARFAGRAYALHHRTTAARRELDYVRYIGASTETAKEVQLFSLAPWLADRFRLRAARLFAENRRLTLSRAFLSTCLSLIGALGYYGAFAVLVTRAASGVITIGTLTFLVAAFKQCRELVQQLLLAMNGVYTQSLYFADVFTYLQTRPATTAPPTARRPVPRVITRGFRFENVGFRYPDGNRWALRGVSLELRPSERVALVGENGAGKTTLTKLLAGLYEPTEGRILLDGVDLSEYDVGDLRRRIGVIFQDFVKYDMRFDENIGVGAVDSVHTYLNADPTANGGPPSSIAAAAEKSLAALLVPRFRHGYRQMLGRRFAGGVDLSGGEWQKVALARAYMRDAQVLVLDEPTAALDARAESEVFARCTALMAGKMVLIISHRYCNVRMAERILVLRNGGIAEQGTHTELLAHDGMYAELFRLQANGYR
jgi:ATP-binding cassette subfamily B protein